MEKQITFEIFEQLDCNAEFGEGTNSVTILFPKDKEGKLLVKDIANAANSSEWESAKFIVFDAVNDSHYSVALTLEFWDEDNKDNTADLVSTIGILPGLRTRVSFPVEALNSQNMFLDRTPGKLKTVIHGNKVRRLKKMAIGKKKCSYDQALRISNLYISDQEPDYPVPKVKLVDDLGQWAASSWPGKTLNAEELITYLDSEFNCSKETGSFSHWSEYGGWKNKRFDSTGFFRTQKEGERWWIVDPEGYAFFSVGVDCIGTGEGCNSKGIEDLFDNLPDRDGEYSEAWSNHGIRASFPHFNFTISNLIRAFGSGWMESWSAITKRRLKEWGINTIGNWSSLEFIERAKMPYVIPLAGFPETKKKIFRDFPDVFSKEYEINSNIFAKQLENFKNDKYMIGYFLRNEPTWAFINGLNIAEELLENDEQFYTKDALICFISEQYNGEIKKFNDAWNIKLAGFDELKNGIVKAARLSKAAEKDLKDFSKTMIELYVKIPSQAVKKVDLNHLNLGMRYGYISSEELLSGSENFDVFSVNCYDVNPYEAVERIGNMTGLPVMIGEYHFGALDRGLSATGIRAVSSQKERAKAYKYYLENAASSNYCVGAHYFQYNDQPALGRFDGENYQIGLVDVCQKVHEEFTAGICECSQSIYEVADGIKEKYDVVPNIIYPIFF